MCVAYVMCIHYAHTQRLVPPNLRYQCACASTKRNEDHITGCVHIDIHTDTDGHVRRSGRVFGVFDQNHFIYRNIH